MRSVAMIALAAFAMGGLSAPVLAAPCKDAKGKFTKCPPAPAARCRKDGKFAKCGTPGAVAVKQ